MHLTQRGGESRSSKVAVMAVSQEADCEDSPRARVFLESVTELVRAAGFFWRAQTEATVRALVINISQEAMIHWIDCGDILFSFESLPGPSIKLEIGGRDILELLAESMADNTFRRESRVGERFAEGR